MPGRPLAVRAGMGRVQPRRRQSVGAISLPQSVAASLSAALKLSRSTAAGLSVQVDQTTGSNPGDASYRYVRPGAPAGGTGMSWSSPFNALPTTPQRGLTYWIADGTYPGRTLNTAPQGTTKIWIRKATPAVHGGDLGWSDSFGAGQAVFTGGLYLQSNWWEIDGTSGGFWATSGYGIRINHQTGPGVDFKSSNNIVRRLQVVGNGGDGGGVFPPNSSFAWIQQGGSNNNLVSHCYAYNAGQCIFFCNNPNTGNTVEYVRTGWFESTGAEHAEIASIWGFGGATANWTFRHNLFTFSGGTGGLMFDGTGFFVYGNVFYRDPTQPGWAVGNGAVGSWSNSEVLQNCKVFNNTFVNIQTSDGSPNGGGPLVPGSIDLNNANVSQNEARNNVFIGGDRAVDFTWFPNRSHNAFFAVPGAAPSQTEAYISANANPLVNPAAYDFRLTDAVAAAMPAGMALAAPYDIDFNGVTRGADGKWERGALEKV